jgi:hypothetical protein
MRRRLNYSSVLCKFHRPKIAKEPFSGSREILGRL